jgi:exodeoxyribonuclease III
MHARRLSHPSHSRCRLFSCMARPASAHGMVSQSFRAAQIRLSPEPDFRALRNHQARYLEAAVAGVLIGCLYLPNGNPQPGPKFDYKLDWFKRLSKHARTILKQDLPAVLAGDFNVAPTALDIYPTTSWDGDALVQPQSRQAYARLLRQGWTDALRHVHGDAHIYTFWHYMRNRWPRDAGLRLDHILLSPALSGELASAGVDRAVRGQPVASDHAPVWITLRRHGH